MATLQGKERSEKKLEDPNSSIKGKSVPKMYQSNKCYEEWGLMKSERTINQISLHENT